MLRVREGGIGGLGVKDKEVSSSEEVEANHSPERLGLGSGTSGLQSGFAHSVLPLASLGCGFLGMLASTSKVLAAWWASGHPQPLGCSLQAGGSGAAGG